MSLVLEQFQYVRTIILYIVQFVRITEQSTYLESLWPFSENV